MGILVSLPIFVFNNYVNSVEAFETASYSLKNSVLVYAAATSILYGLGITFFVIGALSYCGIVSKCENVGTNFGLLFSGLAVGNFFMESMMDKQIVIGDEWILFIAILGVWLVLTLKKPCDADKCHEACGIGDEGNIMHNIVTIGKLAPLFIASAASLWMLLKNGYVNIANDSDEPLDPNAKTSETMMNWIGNIFAVIGPIFFGMLWDRKRYRFHVQIVTLLDLILSSIFIYLGYVIGSNKLFLLAEMLLGLAAFTTIA